MSRLAGFALAAVLPALALAADPTQPPTGFSAQARDPEAAPVAPEPRVHGVFLMGRQAYALVDGMTVHVGDRLGAGRVSRIDARGVWLAGANGVRLIELAPRVLKPSGQTGPDQNQPPAKEKTP